MQTLAGTRLQVSPVIEAMAWLKLAVTARRHPIFGDPGPLVRGVLRHPDVALLADLMPPAEVKGLPDVLTPSPTAGAWRDVLAAQVAEIESVGDDALAAWTCSDSGVDRRRPASRRVRQLAEDGRLRQRLAAGVARFWQETLDDSWPALEETLAGEIAERSRIIAVQGIGQAFGSVHPTINWTGDSLTMDSRWDHDIQIAGHAFVLAPTVLCGRDVMFQVDHATTTVYYPTSRLGDTGRRGRTGLTEVVGTVRAALLTDLGIARTTTELAARHSVSASTVSYHLGSLHRARLVASRREGRRVLYQRTDRGDAFAQNP